MRIDEIMSRDPVRIDVDEPLTAALERMDEFDIRHLPVVDDERLVGIVSDRDLLEAVGWFPGQDGRLGAFAEADSESRRIRDVMHKQPITAHPDSQLVSVSLDLLLRGIGSLPVLDERGSLVGIVTDTDLIDAFLRASWEDRLGPDDDPPVSRYMAAEVVSAHPDTTLEQARALCRKHRIRHLPILDGRELAGLVSDRDLRWGKGRGMPDDEPIASLMTTTLKTITADAPCSHAARLMTESKISSLPIIDGAKLVSIITSTDLLAHCGNTLWQLEGFGGAAS